ncbi:hypothetical protein ACFS3C_08960 [Azotobacter vinelandii]|uniref:hypothetical protein n=1 Tax=Azotobacter TaxID=352 RepID=UPI000ADF2ACE|nr:hypothetical protein [Azotobacter vinelandii]WKN23758.1 hypothetical protein AVAEIV_001867 [Azotobacter vinelandii]
MERKAGKRGMPENPETERVSSFDLGQFVKNGLLLHIAAQYECQGEITMLMAIVLTVVFTWLVLFVAGVCLGRWMRPSSKVATHADGVVDSTGLRLG